MQYACKSTVRLLGFTVLSVWMAAAVAVDGVIEISAPTTISEPGSYRLTQNIEHDNTVIRITVSNVSVDLNGFTISHTGDLLADGISVFPLARNVEISNGAITGFTRYGIFFPAGPNPRENDAEALLTDLRITQNAVHGISIETRRGVVVDRCVLANNGQRGIRMDTGLLINSTIINNGALGMSGSTSTGYGSNVFFGNNGGAAQVSAGAQQVGINVCGTNTVCP